MELPALPKKLLKALGFEKVDATTFVGVLPVFINLGDEQEIEIELGVGIPEMRKKVLEILTNPKEEESEDKEPTTKTKKSDTKKKKSTVSKSKKSTKSKNSSKAAKSSKKADTGKSKKSSKSSKTKKSKAK